LAFESRKINSTEVKKFTALHFNIMFPSYDNDILNSFRSHSKNFSSKSINIQNQENPNPNESNKGICQSHAQERSSIETFREFSAPILKKNDEDIQINKKTEQ